MGETVSIGEPIENTTVYVLDEAMQLVPVGVRGELYIGAKDWRAVICTTGVDGGTVCAAPYSGVGGERLYRTGDVVRGEHDGTTGVHRASGPAGEAARLPDRAGRSGGGAERAGWSKRSGSGSAGG